MDFKAFNVAFSWKKSCDRAWRRCLKSSQWSSTRSMSLGLFRATASRRYSDVVCADIVKEEGMRSSRAFRWDSNVL